MHKAGLHLGMREDAPDGIGKALQAIDHGNQNVLGVAVFELGHDPQPELGILILFDPQSPKLFLAGIIAAPILGGMLNLLI